MWGYDDEFGIYGEEDENTENEASLSDKVFGFFEAVFLTLYKKGKISAAVTLILLVSSFVSLVVFYPRETLSSSFLWSGAKVLMGILILVAFVSASIMVSCLAALLYDSGLELLLTMGMVLALHLFPVTLLLYLFRINILKWLSDKSDEIYKPDELPLGAYLAAGLGFCFLAMVAIGAGTIAYALWRI